MKHLAAAIVCAVCACLAGGCKEIEEEFSGLVGRVALGPVNGANVKVFDGSLYVSVDSTQGLITTAVTDERGGFRVALPDRYVGRTLIVAAEFPADDAGTAPDERATYIDFDDAGNTVTLNPEDGPWFSMVELFEGLTVTVSVTPWTTAAFMSLASTDDAQTGAGNTRYHQDNARQVQRTMAVSLGLASSLAQTLPAQPDFGGNHPARVPLAIDTTADCAALLFTLVQLDRAAGAFVDDTADGGDTKLDFVRAMFNDACDGVLDGRMNGQIVPLFEAAGAPDVIGQTADGSSKLIRYIEANDAVTAQEEDDISAVGGGSVFPDFADIRASQQESTGVARIIRVDGMDLRWVPHTGGVAVTIRGAGFVRGSSVVLASDTRFTAVPAGSTLLIDESDTGAEGEILSVSNDTLVFTLPDLSAAGVGRGFGLSATRPSAPMNVFLRSDLDGPRNSLRTDRLVSTPVQMQTGSLHILDARVVRMLADGTKVKVSGTINAFGAGVDPETLNAAIDDDVYALELTVYNGGADDITGVAPDVTSTTAQGPQHTVTIDTFGGSKPNPALIVPSAAGIAADAITLAAGDVGTLTVPFVYNQAQIREDGDADVGDTVTITCVVSGTDTGNAATVKSNDDADLPPVTVAASIVRHATAPIVTSGGIPTPAPITAGETGDITWSLIIAGRGGSLHRTIEFTSLTVTIAPDGEVAETYVISGPFGAPPRTANSVSLAGLSLASQDSGSLPFTVSANVLDVAWDLATDSGFSGNVTVRLAAAWREPLSGATGTVSDSTTVSVAP